MDFGERYLQFMILLKVSEEWPHFPWGWMLRERRIKPGERKGRGTELNSMAALYNYLSRSWTICQRWEGAQWTASNIMIPTPPKFFHFPDGDSSTKLSQWRDSFHCWQFPLWFLTQMLSSVLSWKNLVSHLSFSFLCVSFTPHPEQSFLTFLVTKCVEGFFSPTLRNALWHQLDILNLT